MTYKQLAKEQRYQIYALLKIGKTEAKIAKFLGVHRSTINRELKRNKGKKGYRPKQAHEIAVERNKKSKKKQSGRIGSGKRANRI